MSSLRATDRDLEGFDVDLASGSWIVVQSPLRERPAPSAAGVILSIADLRRRYASGVDEPLVVDEPAEYGSGDPSLARDISESLDRTWDD